MSNYWRNFIQYESSGSTLVWVLLIIKLLTIKLLLIKYWLNNNYLKIIPSDLFICLSRNACLFIIKNEILYIFFFSFKSQGLIYFIRENCRLSVPSGRTSTNPLHLYLKATWLLHQIVKILSKKGWKVIAIGLNTSDACS